MSTLIAVKNILHFSASHFHEAHWHAHWLIRREQMYDTVSTCCIQADFCVTASIHGIWDAC